MSITTLSIKDIYYPIMPDTAFHPINIKAALHRIRYDFETKARNTISLYPATMDMLLASILLSPRAQATWATVFEYCGEPFYVVRNLAHTNTTLPYRRVLVVKLDAFIIPYPIRTWDRVHSSLSHEEFYPSPSETMLQ